MESVKKAFGFILLGTALWLVSPYLPPSVETAGWGLLLIIPAILMRAYRRLPKTGVTGPMRTGKFLGVAMLIAGTLLLVNAVWWQEPAGNPGQFLRRPPARV